MMYLFNKISLSYSAEFFLHSVKSYDVGPPKDGVLWISSPLKIGLLYASKEVVSIGWVEFR
jgi:hypothetical protein